MTRFFAIILLITSASCQLFQKQNDEQIVARAGSHFLYQSDIEELTSPETPPQDSLLIVRSFIDNWATQKLLMDKAKINLSDEKLKSYDELVSNYKADLYTKGYVDIIATKTLNSEISESELLNYYEINKENFKLNEPLIKIRYLHLGNENKNIDTYKKQLFNFSKEDQENLVERAIQFKTYSFNDSLWVQINSVVEKIPVIQQHNRDELLKKSNSLELQDSLGVYLIYIQDVLLRNEIAPLSYVKTSIEQIILNRRKLDIIKNLEKDILQDAIKNQDFEVYK